MGACEADDGGFMGGKCESFERMAEVPGKFGEVVLIVVSHGEILG